MLFELSSREAPFSIPTEREAPFSAPTEFDLQLTPRVETRRTVGLMIGGAVTFGMSYLTSVGYAYTAKQERLDGYEPFYIPVVGPFVAIETASSGDFGTTAMFATSGVAQATGLVLLIVGLARTRTVVVDSQDPYGLVVSPILGLVSGVNLEWKM